MRESSISADAFLRPNPSLRSLHGRVGVVMTEYMGIVEIVATIEGYPVERRAFERQECNPAAEALLIMREYGGRTAAPVTAAIAA